MRRFALLLGSITWLAGCAGDQTPTGTATNAGSTIQLSAAKEADLRTLQRVTLPFKDFDAAKTAGWSAEITPCMSDPTLGGMGFHFGNVGLIDGTAKVDEPELLLYEPAANGAMHLVAVEYIIPYTFVSKDSPAPVLFGETFTQNDTFQLWGLHVWLYKKNPSGLFASWNPRVSCAATANVSTMQH